MMVYCKLVLPYTERTNAEYRDLRSWELSRLPKMRFARISLNGIHRTDKDRHNVTRYGNPGWSFGFNRCFINWTHFRRHCWHLSFNVDKRGITLSYGKGLV